MYSIGTLQKNGGLDTHYQFVDLVRQLALSVGWEVLRHDTSTANHELIMRAPGLSGAESIYVGIKTYQNELLDYYNLLLGVFTDYSPTNTFETQPGVKMSGIPAHNTNLDYYVVINGQRIVFVLRIAGTHFFHGYAGKFFPYATPQEYPYPVVCAGCLNGAEAYRFSYVNNYFPYHGYNISSKSNMFMLKPSSVWYAPSMYPFNVGNSASTASYAIAGPMSNAVGCEISTKGQYCAEPIIMFDSVSSIALTNSVYGELDGVYFISGFDNSSLNVIQLGGSYLVPTTNRKLIDIVNEIISIGGRAFVMFQNIYRTEWRDYIALEMV